MTSRDPTLLLQELLSPPSRPEHRAETLQLLAYFLSSLPLGSPHLNLITLLCRYSLTSPSLWTPASLGSSQHRDQRSWDGATSIYTAYFQATLLRLDSISRDVGTGFRARRAVSSYLSAVSEGLWIDQVRQRGEQERGTVEPVNRVLVTSAVLAALQEWKRRKERLWVGGRGMLDRIESDVGKAWKEWAEHGRDLSDELPAWLAAQTLPSSSTETVAQSFPSTHLLSYINEAFFAVFDEGNLFNSPSLAADLKQTDEGLAWITPSPSHSRLTEVTQATLFGILGSLSRTLGRLLSSNATLAASYDSSISEPAVSAIKDVSHALITVTTRLSAGWAATPWSDLVEDSDLSPSTRSQTQPWTILKSLLFAQTLIYSSLLEAVSSASTDSHTEPTSGQRELAREAVVALGRTYFVASRFGQGGFKAWRAVLAGLVDVAAAPSPALDSVAGDRLSPAEQLAREMEPPFGDEEEGTHSRLVDRAECTFWMNTVEQVMDELSDSYVEETVLIRCKPYLEAASYPESYESAHSVVLAVFSARKTCVPDLAPWYTRLLLRLPSLSPTQLRHAYTTMVRSSSSFDDALAWWCAQTLVAAIEGLPVSDSPTSLSAAESSNVGRTSLRDLGGDLDSEVAKSRQSPEGQNEPAPSTLESRVLTLDRGSYLVTLVSLLPSVNFVLFRSLLSEISRLVDLEPTEHDGRKALAEWTFEVLGTDMDVVKREEGVRWWMENGRRLSEGRKGESTEAKPSGLREHAEEVAEPAELAETESDM